MSATANTQLVQSIYAAFGQVGSSTPELRAAVEDFLFHEADLLDTWRLDSWLELFTEECSYLIPATDRPADAPAKPCQVAAP